MPITTQTAARLLGTDSDTLRNILACAEITSMPTTLPGRPTEHWALDRLERLASRKLSDAEVAAAEEPERRRRVIQHRHLIRKRSRAAA